jgi:glycosyltransferase involved in cell wall biosynthesis
VTPGDDHALADAIERLVRDQQLRDGFANNAKKLAQENFTLEQVRQLHEDLYVSLLDSKKTNATDWLDFPLHRRIRVAIVAASPHYVGGQSVQADLLVRSWQDDPTIEAHFLPIDPPFPRALAWTKRIPFLRTIIRQPLYLASVWRSFKNVDVAHIFSASFWSFLVAPLPAWLIARLRGKHAIIHYHSGEAREHLHRFPTARPVLEDADCLVAPSGHLINVFREFGLEGRVLPNLVDATQFSFRERRPFRPHLICTRGFHPYYSMDVVVHAFALIQKAFPAATLTLVGTGSTETQIQDLVRELKLASVKFTGAVSHPQIASLYDGADVFINASHLDNMPVSILEAFASGTPVVSTHPEGMEYLIEHERTGLLSPPGDAAALAANALRLLNIPDLASRLALNAHEELQRYTWPAVREQWLEIYSSLHTGSQL